MDESVRKGTICFLRNGNQLLLALIKYGPNDRKWNGIGGFVDPGESLEDAIIREAQEETFIKFDKNHLKKVAELNGSFQLNVFLTNTWSGEIKSKEPSIKELKWFPINELPYSQMHPGNDKWLPMVLEGKLVKTAGDQMEEVMSFD